jgi:hypothetical protein
VQLFQSQVAAGSDVDQHAARAREVDVFQQWAGDGLLSSTLCATFAGSGSCAHHRHAVLGHQRAYVSEVHVHHAWDIDDFGDTCYRTLQHTVRRLECLWQRGLAAQHFHQLRVRNDDERVDVSRQLFDALLRQRHALAFEHERLGDDGNGEDAHLFRHLRHDRSRTGSSATTHTRSDEHHVCATDHVGDAFTVFFCCRLTDGRFGTCAQTFGQCRTDLQLDLGLAAFQGLRIRIDRDEFDTLHALLDHVVDRIATATTHANHLDHCPFRLCI